jgi:SAM-dependent methyltransferase
VALATRPDEVYQSYVSKNASRAALFRLFLAEKTEPRPFYEALAARTVDTLAVDLQGAHVLDLGCGPGYYSDALRGAGAVVIGVDADREELRGPDGFPQSSLAADGGCLPFADATFDGVFCSNVLEHTPDTARIFDEIERILCPGGWAWVSWTNWYSPWGGHEITPFHYLGPKRGLAVHRLLRGEPRKNLPGEGLFPVHVGRTLAQVRGRNRFRMVDARPRYYPSQRWILSVPVLREVLTWNCVLLLERSDAA